MALGRRFYLCCLSASHIENDIELNDYDKELRHRNLSEVQLNILELISNQPSITLNELAIKLAVSISALRNQRSQMEKKGVWVIKFDLK